MCIYLSATENCTYAANQPNTYTMYNNDMLTTIPFSALHTEIEGKRYLQIVYAILDMYTINYSLLVTSHSAERFETEGIYDM